MLGCRSLSDARVCTGGFGLWAFCLAQACGSHEEGLHGVHTGADGAALPAESEQAYVRQCEKTAAKARALLDAMAGSKESAPMQAEIAKYLYYVELLVDQIRRRILKGETIPHAENVFFIHKPHTRWISKGRRV